MRMRPPPPCDWRLLNSVPPGGAIPAAAIGLPASAGPSAEMEIAPAPVIASRVTPAVPADGPGAPAAAPMAEARLVEGPPVAGPASGRSSRPTPVDPAPASAAGESGQTDALTKHSTRLTAPVAASGPGEVVVQVKATSPQGLKNATGDKGDGLSPVASGPAGAPHGHPLMMAEGIPNPAVAVAPLPGSQGPGRLTAPDSPYAQRAPEERKGLVEKLGGNRESEAAVERGLAYLARFQEPNGRWTYVDDDREPGKRAARRMTWLTPVCRFSHSSPRITSLTSRVRITMLSGAGLNFSSPTRTRTATCAALRICVEPAPPAEISTTRGLPRWRWPKQR